MSSYKKDIKALRKFYGLPDIRIEKKTCLRCDAKFISQDAKANRLCERCNKSKSLKD